MSIEMLGDTTKIKTRPHTINVLFIVVDKERVVTCHTRYVTKRLSRTYRKMGFVVGGWSGGENGIISRLHSQTSL